MIKIIEYIFIFLKLMPHSKSLMIDQSLVALVLLSNYLCVLMKRLKR